MTFEASINDTKLTVAMLMGTFRGGSFGAGRGLSLVEATLRGRPKSAILSSPMCTARPASGIQEAGTHGVIQMPRWVRLPCAGISIRAACTWFYTIPIPLPGLWPASLAVRHTSLPSGLQIYRFLRALAS